MERRTQPVRIPQYLIMNRTKNILAILLLAMAPSFAAAQQQEVKSPERIARMVESMPVKNLPANGSFACTELSSTVQFYTESAEGVIVQLGARLFSDNVRKAYDPVIISFVERLWAELLLRKTTQSQAALLKEYGVRIVLGGYPLGVGAFSSLGQALDVINSLTSLSLTTGGSEIDMFMRGRNSETLHIYIPSSRDLLFQYDKKEHEELLIRELSRSKASYKQTMPDIGDLTTDEDGLLVTGGECYMIDSLRNDIFLTSQRKPVFSETYPEQSMRNILMGAAATEYVTGKTLDIRLHTYNRSLGGIQLPLDRFLGYVQQEGFRFYTGKLDRNGDKCQCLLAMYHPVYNYLHILSLSFTPQELVSKQPVTLKADLSTFIPQHNIKNLFQEK